jgi:tight adherence protein B
MSRRGGADLPEVVETMASAIAAGGSVAAAIERAASGASNPLDVELRSVVAVVRRGVPVADAVDRWSTRSEVDGARLVAAAISLALHAGGEVDAALRGVAATLRERRSLDREVRALSSQARLSAAVIGVSPVAFGVVAALTDPATARFLVRTPLGGACLAAGATLDLLGWCWMQRISGSVR